MAYYGMQVQWQQATRAVHSNTLWHSQTAYRSWWVSLYLPLNSWWYPSPPAYNNWSQAIDGSLSFSGGLVKKTGKIVDGTLPFIGGFFWRLFRLLTAGLTFMGTLTTVLVPAAAMKIRGKRKTIFSWPEEIYQWLM